MVEQIEMNFPLSMHSQRWNCRNHVLRRTYVLKCQNHLEFHTGSEIQWGIHRYKPWGEIESARSSKIRGKTHIWKRGSEILCLAVTCPKIGKCKSGLKREWHHRLELLDKPSDRKNIWRFGSLDFSMTTLKRTRGKGNLRDYVVEKGTFLVLGVVGIVGAKVVSNQFDMCIYLWLSSLA